MQDSTNRLDHDPSAPSFPKLPGGVSITPAQPERQATVQKVAGAAELGSHERAAAARALEALGAALDPSRLVNVDAAEIYRLLGFASYLCGRVALSLRQGYRAEQVDRATADLDQFMAEMLGGGGDAT